MTNNNYVAGINEAKIDSLILAINNYAERINNILTNIDDLIDTNVSYLNCSSKEKFKKIHNENRSNFQITVKNILSYADDLAKVKNYYNSTSANAARNITNSVGTIGK